MDRELSFHARVAKIPLGSGCFRRFQRAGRLFPSHSGSVEDQDSAVVEGNLPGRPGRTLVDARGVGIGWIPGTVEPVEVRCVIGDPFLDRLPRWFDGLQGLDVEGRRWRAWEREAGVLEN